MTKKWEWNPCVNHRDNEYGQHAKQFIQDYFSCQKRRTLILAGAGFDPRSIIISKLLVESAKNRIHGGFIREDRPNPSNNHLKSAEENVENIKNLFASNYELVSIDIFSSDGAVIGGRETIKFLKKFNFRGFTDIIVDISAMSIGVSYPMIRYLYNIAIRNKIFRNLHLMVIDDPSIDSKIIPTASDKVGAVFGFQGGFGLDANTEAVKLWLPQLMLGKKGILEKIHTYISEPKDICPILPLSESDPRLADTLVDYYRDEFESSWVVDERNIVYADERNPLDLYRSILRIDDARKRVFADIRGSMVVLSPVGSKASAIGALMAAIERDFPVVYVEATDYTTLFDESSSGQVRDHNRIVHVWLRGDAYP